MGGRGGDAVYGVYGMTGAAGMAGPAGYGGGGGGSVTCSAAGTFVMPPGVGPTGHVPKVITRTCRQCGGPHGLAYTCQYCGV